MNENLRSARLVTLGCRLNQADSALLTDRLQQLGYCVTGDDDSRPVELIIVNSCAVTAAAASKSRQAARKLQKLYPAARVVFTGCAAELVNEAAHPEGWLCLSNLEKRELADFLQTPVNEHLPRKSIEFGKGNFCEKANGLFPFRTRAFIKIQEGCDNFCTYCIVPYTRGASRSRDHQEVISDCRQAVEAGSPEIVLTGVNTCNYTDGGYDLEKLIDTLCCDIPGNWRLRLSSTEPALGNLSLLHTMAKYQSKVCRFLHLALQHGADSVLKRMNRHYTVDDYRRFVDTARELIADIHLGSDVIVGFPGETDGEFESSCKFIEEIGFANLHVFSYSKRAGTPAASMPDQVPDGIKKIRHQQLETLAGELKNKFIGSMRGKTLPVIFETVDKEGQCHGWSDNYINVIRPANEVPLAKIVDVKF